MRPPPVFCRLPSSAPCLLPSVLCVLSSAPCRLPSTAVYRRLPPSAVCRLPSAASRCRRWARSACSWRCAAATSASSSRPGDFTAAHLQLAVACSHLQLAVLGADGCVDGCADGCADGCLDGGARLGCCNHMQIWMTSIPLQSATKVKATAPTPESHKVGDTSA